MATPDPSPPSPASWVLRDVDQDEIERNVTNAHKALERQMRLGWFDAEDLLKSGMIKVCAGGVCGGGEWFSPSPHPTPPPELFPPQGRRWRAEPVAGEFGEAVCSGRHALLATPTPDVLPDPRGLADQRLERGQAPLARARSRAGRDDGSMQEGRAASNQLLLVIFFFCARLPTAAAQREGQEVGFGCGGLGRCL